MLDNILTADENAELNRLIDESDKVIICCHTSPDGDAIGSILGFADFLRNRGKKALMIVPNAFPDFLRWMPGVERIVRYDKHQDTAEQSFEEAQLIFCMDFNSSKRLEDMSKALTKSKAKKVMIDHHPDPDIDCTLTISHPEMSSTCEIAFRVIWQLGGFESMMKSGAVPLYCGMMTDTGGFTYNSTSPDIYYIISQLLTKKIDKDKIYRNVYNNYSESRLRLTGYILYQKMVVFPEYHSAYFTLTREEMLRFHFLRGDAEGLVNMPLQIKGTKLSISLREDTEKDNVIRVSLRSVDNFPCNRVSELFFNGGGHLNASGGELHCTMEEAEEVVKRALTHFEKELK